MGSHPRVIDYAAENETTFVTDAGVSSRGMVPGGRVRIQGSADEMSLGAFIALGQPAPTYGAKGPSEVNAGRAHSSGEACAAIGVTYGY